MRTYVGIDLGSTTTKAVILDEGGAILGRGITNSRSNYDVACAVALDEGLTSARFARLSAHLGGRGAKVGSNGGGAGGAEQLPELGRRFRLAQYRAQLTLLRRELLALAGGPGGLASAVSGILSRMDAEAEPLFVSGASRKSDFFRDLAGSRYLELAEQVARTEGLPFDTLVGCFDRAILTVENTPADDAFESHVRSALAELRGAAPALEAALERVLEEPLEPTRTVGTGYGRARLPFPKSQIRSEILCHGLGAHALFPGTRTVLDIGGQDTKAIQVDEAGIVTSFQMNDRCAAGCGRYLGYIADEMNLGLQELGPLAQQSCRPARINSTCTVFAGAELRERLALGEKREDILAGLHRAIVLRAMSLLARSGGVRDEFTFTGGVARNPAAVAALSQLVRENYGQLTLNISPDSIYTGALGAALFALSDARSAAPDVPGAPAGPAAQAAPALAGSLATECRS